MSNFGHAYIMDTEAKPDRDTGPTYLAILENKQVVNNM